MTRQRADWEKEDGVRNGLQAAMEAGMKLQAVLDKMRGAGFDIKSPIHTVQKFKTDPKRSLKTGDLEKMHRYFTKNDFGRLLLGKAATSTDSVAATTVSAQPAQTPLRIGAAAPPKPESLTGAIRLASILIECTQWGRGTVCASFTVACADWHGYAVQRGRVAMDPHPGRLVETEETGWSKTTIVATQGYGRVGQAGITRGCSTVYDPFWDIYGMGMPIGRFTTDGDFAPLEGLSPGDRVTATFGTWLSDIEQTDAVAGVELQNDSNTTDGLALVNAEKSDERIADPKGFKRRLISIIRATALDAKPDGYVELSKCTVDLVEG